MTKQEYLDKWGGTESDLDEVIKYGIQAHEAVKQPAPLQSLIERVECEKIINPVHPPDFMFNNGIVAALKILRSVPVIKAKAHQLTPNKKWVVWAEDGKYLPSRSSFDHFDIEILLP